MFQNNDVFSTPINQTPSFDDKFGKPAQTAGDLSSGPVKSVRVISVNFLEMVEHQHMGFRPYISKVTDTRVLDILPDFVREQKSGMQFKSETLNPIVNDIIGLSPNVLGGINIVNGWNIKRYSFWILAEVVFSNNSKQNLIVEGFTDSPEISTNGQNIFIDPELMLFVNNVTIFSERSNLQTGHTSLVPVQDYNVISKNAFNDPMSARGVFTQRPYDVASMSLQGVLAGNTSNFIIDARSSLGVGEKTSTLANNNPATYVAKIINDGISAITNSNTDNIFNTTAIGNMLSYVNEPSLACNGFLRQLGRIQSDYPTATTSFAWKDLTVIDPALLSPSCPYLNVSPVINRDAFLPGSGLVCDDVSGSGNEQVFASMIANGVVDLLSRCRAYQVNVMATNHSGFDDVKVIGMHCYDPNEFKIQAQLFERLFEANVINLVNQNTRFSYNIAVTSSKWGDTFVKINLGYGSYDFIYPNFANGTWSPILTNDKVSTENISKHMLTIANTVNDTNYSQLSSNPGTIFGGSVI